MYQFRRIAVSSSTEGGNVELPPEDETSGVIPTRRVMRVLDRRCRLASSMDARPGCLAVTAADAAIGR